MSALLKFISIEAIIEYLTKYLGQLLAGSIKSPTSDKARLLFRLLDALKVLIDEINSRRADARAAASLNIAGIASVNNDKKDTQPDFWAA
jgi:hypothetical protein